MKLLALHPSLVILVCANDSTSGRSVMSNIAEGYERRSEQEFYQFLSISKGSCAEVRSQLYLALDIGYIDKVVFDDLIVLGEELGKVIGGLRNAISVRTK